MEGDPKIHGDSILPEEAKPSGLYIDLGSFKDPETGHVMVTPSQAKELLLDRLILEYKSMTGNGLHPDIGLPPGFWSNPVLEALDIARKAQGQKRVDLTQVLETLMEKRSARQSEHRKRMGHPSSIPANPEDYDGLP